MKRKLKSILLIDDREDCNYMHKMVIDDMDCAESIEIAYNGKQAIDFLKENAEKALSQPEIIFLDLNMPVMDGWEFLEEYHKIKKEIKNDPILVMLTTSLNPKDQERAAQNKDVKEYVTKFLDEESLSKIIKKYFINYL